MVRGCMISELCACMQGMAPDIGMLRGEALLEEDGVGSASVRLLCAEALPPDPAARFAALFKARPRWLLAELQPYIADLQACLCLMQPPCSGLCIALAFAMWHFIQSACYTSLDECGLRSQMPEEPRGSLPEQAS